MRLLDTDREEDEAYLATDGNDGYLLYFTQGGSVTIKTGNPNDKQCNVKWINIETGEWGSEEVLEIKDSIRVNAPDNSGWFAIITIFK